LYSGIDYLVDEAIQTSKTPMLTSPFLDFLRRKIMKRIIFFRFLLIAFTLFSTSNAQREMPCEKKPYDYTYNTSNSGPDQWAKSYGENSGGDNIGYCIRQTSDGGFICTGLTWAFGAGRCDIWVLKLSSEGEVEWQRTYGGSGYDGYWDIHVQQTNDGGYIVSADTNSFSLGGDRDVWVLKLFSNGDIDWQQTYGGTKWDDPDGGIQITRDGGFIIMGVTDSGASTGYDMWILKLTSQGGVEWQKKYGGVGDEYGYSIQQTSDGGYIAAGSSENSSNGYDIWILKLSSKGNIEWQRLYECGARTAYLNPYCKVLQTKDGGYIVADSTDTFGAGEHDFWVLKLNSRGDVEWQRTYGGSDTDVVGIEPIIQTSDGGCVVVGYTHSFGAENSDCWILKLNSNGGIKWQRTLGKSGYDVAFSVHEANDGDYVVAGYKGFSSNTWGALILKFSPNGEIGPGCGFIESSNATVVDTAVSYSVTSVKAIDTNVVPQKTNIYPQDTDIIPELLCWSLNQPPADISLKEETNRSLFRKEVFHTLQWSSNPYNNQFIITEYRIYRKERYGDEGYQLIGTVPGNTFEYRDGPFVEPGEFDYSITSVDSEGHESPKSESVGNP